MLQVNHLIGFGAYQAGGAATGAEIDRTLGTNIGDMSANGGLAASFDGTTNQAAAACSRTATSVSNAYIGKTGNISRIISKATIHGSNNLGYNDNAVGTSCTAKLYAKTGAAPANGTDGTLLGSITFTQSADESAGRDITSSDTSTLWAHWWIYHTQAGAANNISNAEARFFE